MDQIVPATGRVLRYWCSSLAARCRHRLYDYLQVRPIEKGGSDGAVNGESWTGSEVWSRPAPDHALTKVTDKSGQTLTVPRLTTRASCEGAALARPRPRPSGRRAGRVVSETFRTTRVRLNKARSATPGISLI